MSCLNGIRAGLEQGLKMVDTMCTRFHSRFALTDEERTEIVVDSRDAAALRTSRWLLVGKLLADKPFNRDAFKRTMATLWRPRARVSIVEIDHGLFSFSFPSMEERSRVLAGGPWLFDGFLLVLAAADGIVNPYKLPLVAQEFWIQAKGLPLAFMTRKMGSIIGNALGTHVVTDQSKKGELVGSYLRIRASIDISKPLRRSLMLRIDGEQVEIDIRYEKLPLTCYWCGVIGHSEGTCSSQPSPDADDLQKPYGQWFQRDTFHPNYRRASGRRFGLSPERPWSIRAPPSTSVSEDADVDMLPPVAGATLAMERSTGPHDSPNLWEGPRAVTSSHPTRNIGSPSIPTLPDLNCPAPPEMALMTDLNINWENAPTSTPMGPCMASHVINAWDLNFSINVANPMHGTLPASCPLSMQTHANSGCFDQTPHVEPPPRASPIPFPQPISEDCRNQQQGSLGSDPFNLGPLILKSTATQPRKQPVNRHKGRRRTHRVHRPLEPSIGTKRRHDPPSLGSNFPVRKRQLLVPESHSLSSTAAADSRQPCREP